MVSGTTCVGDVNQALNKLGSTVCKPQDPDHNGCPLQQWCRVFQISQKVIVTHLALASVSLVLTPRKCETEDVEDVWTLCKLTPISECFEAPPVTPYPMKFEPKRQRE